MRGVIAILFIAALGGLFLWQKNGQQSEPTAVPKQAVHQTVSSAPAASPTREVSEHNWMKRSLDRAREVRDQARTNTRDSQNP